MSQHDFNIANQGFPAFRADLNDGLAALASNSAGTAEPTTTYAYQFWYDETSDLLKMRNGADDAWITLAAFDQTNDEWEVRSAVIQAVDSAGVVIKTDDGTTRIEVQDDGDVSIDSGTLFVDAGNNNVGVGTTSPENVSAVPDLTVAGKFFTSDGTPTNPAHSFTGDQDTGMHRPASNTLAFATGGTEAARIDSSGNLLVGKTNNDSNEEGSILYSDSATGASGAFTSDDNRAIIANRKNSDGEIIGLRKNGSTVGSIGSRSGVVSYYIIDPRGSGVGFTGTTTAMYPCYSGGGAADNVYDWGFSSARWDDIFATNGTIQTSDRNEKQDIEELTEAEQRVAVAAKSLLRKFRWIKRVEEKGDDARIHFGIIAQDLQAAFEVEGLDAGRYAMFIYSEWWETYTDVPAVEAVDAVYETVTDEEGNETQVLVSEAVEAKEAYTRTDTYDTEEEAPEGAVKKSRMGVRYSELLAFIIAAI